MARPRTPMGKVGSAATLAAIFLIGTHQTGTFFWLFVVILLVLIVASVRSAARVARDALQSPPVADMPDDAAVRLSELAGELMVPGGRGNDEVMQEAALVYAQLPSEVKARLEASGHSHPGLRVEASGPFGRAVARAAGLPVTPPPTVQAKHAEVSHVPPTAPEPDGASAVAARPDSRFGVLAPDELTGAEVTPPRSVAEGWYRTADGTRERWHNGAGWTAHERAPGSS